MTDLVKKFLLTFLLVSCVQGNGKIYGTENSLAPDINRLIKKYAPSGKEHIVPLFQQDLPKGQAPRPPLPFFNKSKKNKIPSAPDKTKPENKSETALKTETGKRAHLKTRSEKEKKEIQGIQEIQRPVKKNIRTSQPIQNISSKEKEQTAPKKGQEKDRTISQEAREARKENKKIESKTTAPKESEKTRKKTEVKTAQEKEKKIKKEAGTKIPSEKKEKQKNQPKEQNAQQIKERSTPMQNEELPSTQKRRSAHTVDLPTTQKVFTPKIGKVETPQTKRLDLAQKKEVQSISSESKKESAKKTDVAQNAPLELPSASRVNTPLTKKLLVPKAGRIEIPLRKRLDLAQEKKAQKISLESGKESFKKKDLTRTHPIELPPTSRVNTLLIKKVSVPKAGRIKIPQDKH